MSGVDQAHGGSTERGPLSLDQAAALSASLRASGASVGLCHGVFDLLHPGHFRHIAAARQQADVLFVSITGDAFVNKGPGRPAFPQDLRAEALAGLKDVDYVVISPEATALTVLEAIRPSVYVKGQDYANADDDPTGNFQRERDVVERHGGRVVFTDEIVFSSSNLINRFIPQHSDDVREWLAQFRDVVTLDEVNAYLDRMSELTVTIIGETILDSYSACEALGKASKEPVLCMRLGDTVTHSGGTLAVAGHAHGLGVKVNLVTGVHSSSLSDPAVIEVEKSGVTLHAIATDPAPTIRKWRIMDQQTQSRMLELYEMDDSPISLQVEERLISAIEECASKSDVVIIADYGHGLLSDRVISYVCGLDVFLAVNAQANAGNHGFNSLGKYHRADFATLNGGEARLEVRRRHLDLDQYIPMIRERLGAQAVLVTQGGSGTYLYLNDGEAHPAPALAPFVKDRVGAGDALLTVTSLLMYLGAPAPLIGFLGNLVGAWAVSFLGNEQTLDLGTLKRQATSILK